jgi:hypothetical protein
MEARRAIYGAASAPSTQTRILSTENLPDTRTREPLVALSRQDKARRVAMTCLIRGSAVARGDTGGAMRLASKRWRRTT